MLFATIKSMTVWKFGTVAKTVYLNIDVEPVERDQEFPRFHLECGHGDE